MMNVDGCFGNDVASWDSLEWEYTAKPAGTAIKFRARVATALANNPDDIAWSEWYPRADTYYEAMPSDLTAIPKAANKYMQLELTLVSHDDNQTPVFRSFTLNRTCTRSNAGE